MKAVFPWRVTSLLAFIATLFFSMPGAIPGERLAAQQRKEQPRPNIVWFVVDDMSPNFSCYGERLIQTPNVDRLAREGVRFTRAFTTAPVCSPSRSAMITGMYQTSIGAHQHRSGRGEHLRVQRST